jgi:hypothetical protein
MLEKPSGNLFTKFLELISSPPFVIGSYGLCLQRLASYENKTKVRLAGQPRAQFLAKIAALGMLLQIIFVICILAFSQDNLGYKTLQSGSIFSQLATVITSSSFSGVIFGEYVTAIFKKVIDSEFGLLVIIAISCLESNFEHLSSNTIARIYNTQDLSSFLTFGPELIGPAILSAIAIFFSRIDRKVKIRLKQGEAKSETAATTNEEYSELSLGLSNFGQFGLLGLGLGLSQGLQNIKQSLPVISEPSTTFTTWGTLCYVFILSVVGACFIIIGTIKSSFVTFSTKLRALKTLSVGYLQVISEDSKLDVHELMRIQFRLSIVTALINLSVIYLALIFPGSKILGVLAILELLKLIPRELTPV